MERFHQKLKALTLDNMLMSNDKEILCLEVFLVVTVARHYNPRFVYFLPTFWSPKTIF